MDGERSTYIADLPFKHHHQQQAKEEEVVARKEYTNKQKRRKNSRADHRPLGITEPLNFFAKEFYVSRCAIHGKIPRLRRVLRLTSSDVRGARRGRRGSKVIVEECHRTLCLFTRNLITLGRRRLDFQCNEPQTVQYDEPQTGRNHAERCIMFVRSPLKGGAGHESRHWRRTDQRIP